MSTELTALYQAVAVPGTGEKVTATPLAVRRAIVIATREDAVNTGLVFVGDSTVNKDSSRQRYLSPGDEWDVPIARGRTFDLSTLYVDAVTVTDGVCVMYQT